MPIIKSAIKRARQTIKRRSHNLQVKRAVHDDIRALEAAILTGDKDAIATAFKAAQSEIDRAVKKGTLHRNTAGRRKSVLSAHVVKAASPKAVATESKTTKGAGGGAKKTTPTKATAKKSPTATKTPKATTAKAPAKTTAKKPAATKPSAK